MPKVASLHFFIDHLLSCLLYDPVIITDTIADTKSYFQLEIILHIVCVEYFFLNEARHFTGYAFSHSTMKAFKRHRMFKSL